METAAPATLSLPDFETFRRQALTEGATEVLERHWAAHTVVPKHTHPFAVRALVVQGDMWLGTGAEPARHLQPGDRFELAREQPHTERYGAKGATYWVARQG